MHIKMLSIQGHHSPSIATPPPVPKHLNWTRPAPASSASVTILGFLGSNGLSGLDDRKIENLETVEVIFGEKSPLIPNWFMNNGF